jgi:hypothetical protein
LKPIQIFRTGTHTAMNGLTATFGEADLAGCAAAYDPARHEAPIVVGHPAADAPAYGWVRSLKAEGGALYAEPHQVDPAFQEMVTAGRFKKVSAAFYLPDAPANPAPGKMYLRHVGFLGAQAPAVKGLKAVEFAAGEEGVVTVEFGEVRTWPLKDALRIGRSLFQGLRDHLIETMGKDKADQVLPAESIADMTSLIENVPAPAPEPASSAGPALAETQQEEPMSEKNKKETTPGPEAEKDSLAAERAQLEKDKAAFAEAKRLDEAKAFVNALVKDGKVLPRDAAGLASFMAKVDGGEASFTVLFAEGEKTVEKPGAQFLREFLSGLPKAVEFAEVAAGGKAGPVDGADPDAIARAAVAYQEEMKAKGTVVGVAEAVRHVTKG